MTATACVLAAVLMVEADGAVLPKRATHAEPGDARRERTEDLPEAVGDHLAERRGIVHHSRE